MCKTGLLFVVLISAGCIHEGMVAKDGAGRAVAVASGVGAGLAAAEDEGEFTGILTEPEPETPAPVVSAPRPKRFGVRTGLMMPLGAEEGEWGSALLAGVFYRFNQLAEKSMAVELGLDFSSVERDDGSVTSTLLVFRGEVLLGRSGPGGSDTSVYFVGGADLISETAKLELSGDTESGFGAGVNIGVGVGSRKGLWDARAAYSLFPGSGNVGGSLMVTAGLSF